MLKGADTFLNPQKVYDQLDIQQGMRVADFGCGHGYFTIPIAKIVGENGHVYALDVQQNALDIVRDKANTDNLANIEIIRCNLETHCRAEIKESTLDLVLLTSTLFQSENKTPMIVEASRVLKDNGQLLVIDWQTNAVLAPKEFWPISKEEMTDLIELQGFKFEKDIAVDLQHYGLLFIKK